MKNDNSKIDTKGIESDFLNWFGMSNQSSCKIIIKTSDSRKEDNLLTNSIYTLVTGFCFHKNLY